ncbi:MAG: hypothetical protein HY720_08520 [Planctomycetes bacterium]|nr:hypothetical protein [Planctomycetota bacterium]
MPRFLTVLLLSLWTIQFSPCVRAQENGGEEVPEAVQAILDRVHTLDHFAVANTKIILRDSTGDTIFTFEYEEQDGVHVLAGFVETYGEVVEMVEVSNVELEFEE